MILIFSFSNLILNLHVTITIYLRPENFALKMSSFIILSILGLFISDIALHCNYSSWLSPLIDIYHKFELKGASYTFVSDQKRYSEVPSTLQLSALVITI